MRHIRSNPMIWFRLSEIKGMERFFTVSQNVPFVLEYNNSTSRLPNMKFCILTQRFINLKCFYISILLCHMYPINVIVLPRAYRLDSNFITIDFLSLNFGISIISSDLSSKISQELDENVVAWRLDFQKNHLFDLKL